jgi:hypothetical protein
VLRDSAARDAFEAGVTAAAAGAAHGAGVTDQAVGAATRAALYRVGSRRLRGGLDSQTRPRLTSATAT